MLLIILYIDFYNSKGGGLFKKGKASPHVTAGVCLIKTEAHCFVLKNIWIRLYRIPKLNLPAINVTAMCISFKYNLLKTIYKVQWKYIEGKKLSAKGCN